MTPSSRTRVDRFWAAHLGCAPNDLRRSTTIVVAGPSGYHGVHALRHADACILSVPPAWLQRAARAANGRPAGQVFDAGFLRELFGEAVDRKIGPAFLGYADASCFRPADPRGSRLLLPQDEPALPRLAAACDPVEWDHSGIEWGAHPVYGCFDGEELAAAGTLEPWGADLLHVGILTHPARRGQGYGRAVVSAMTASGLEQERVVQYRTLRANAPSVAVAHALGFQEYGATLAVRFLSA